MDYLITTVPGMESFLRCRDLPSFCRGTDLNHFNLPIFVTETQRSPQAHALIFNTFDDLEGPALSHIRTHCSKVYTIGPLHSLLKFQLQAHALIFNTFDDLERPALSHIRTHCSKVYTIGPLHSLLRYQDLPNFCRGTDLNHFNLPIFVTETQRSPQAHALIFNTFDDLEGPALSHIQTHCSKVYTIGPLHSLLKFQLEAKRSLSQSQSSNSLFEVDRSCMTWLDAQPLKSVIYVSFGSISTMTKDEHMEFWFGLVNSKKRFLWVLQSDSVVGEHDRNEVPIELVDGTKERGFVSEVWKLGLDMKDVCDRFIVEKMVNDLMGERRKEFMKSTTEMARLARKSASEGGSSYCNLGLLDDDIRLMSMGAD
nr:7-deoxyloganetic acid glucosyltransferase [Quercus suber]